MSHRMWLRAKRRRQRAHRRLDRLRRERDRWILGCWRDQQLVTALGSIDVGAFPNEVLEIRRDATMGLPHMMGLRFHVRFEE